MLPAPSLVHRTPGPAIAAAVLGVVSATVPALALLFVAVMAGSELWESDAAWLLVPVVLVAGLIAGAVLLLLGRSWLALALPAGALTALVLAGYLLGGWGGGGPFGPVSLLAPPATTVLSALPSVRHWVAARRWARALSTAGSRP
jgi:hypothetical protein